MNFKVITSVIYLLTISTLSHAMQGDDKIPLPFAYYSPTQKEKNYLKIVAEGEYTVFNSTDDCAVVGPLSPCQLVALDNENTTIVGHLAYSANLSTLLNAAQQTFKGHDLSKTRGNVLTVSLGTKEYVEPRNQVDGYLFSIKDCYQGRSQLEELKKVKDTIIDTFGITNRTQINANLFKPKKIDYINEYELATHCVFLKKTERGTCLFSICPMAENIYGEFTNLPLEERLYAFDKARKEKSKQSTYLQQFAHEPYSPALYGKYPFVKI